MLPELSLNILDIVNNSIRADATLIEVEVRIHKITDQLMIRITDNGRGMTKEEQTKASDPFYTTRTTRRIGLGIPFLKQEALGSGGSFMIESIPGCRTTVTAVSGLTHIDRMPMGDICGTIYQLILANRKIDFLYIYERDGREYRLDTRQVKQMLNGIPIDTPRVSEFIKEYLKENQKEIDGGDLV